MYHDPTRDFMFEHDDFRGRKAMRRFEQQAPVVTLIGPRLTGARGQAARTGQERRCVPGGAPLGESVLILDLLDFETDERHAAKRDAGGASHLIGASRILLAQMLREQLRQCDTLGSWGNAEFLVLLPGATPAIAREIALRLRACISRLDHGIASAYGHLGCAIGIAGVTNQRGNLATLLRQADAALAQARGVERGGIVIAGHHETRA